jgi:hypothetical protein
MQIFQRAENLESNSVVLKNETYECYDFWHSQIAMDTNTVKNTKGNPIFLN